MPLNRDEWAKIGAAARLKELLPAEREAAEIRAFLGKGKRKATASGAAQSKRMKAWWKRRKAEAATKPTAGKKK